MYKHSQRQKCANTSAGKRSDAPLPPRSTDSSDSGASNGKKTPPGKGRTEEPNKKQRTEDPKSDPGTTESRARDRRRDKKANETHAKYAGTVADKDTDQSGDDEKNGNADGQDKHEKMETETSESSAHSDVPGKEKPGSGGRPADETTVGDQKPEDMDTVEENKKLEESDQKDPLDRGNDVGSDEHDGNHDQQAPEPETLPPQDKIKGIKDKAVSRSNKMATAESRKGAPDTKDTEGDEWLTRSHEQRGQQHADARNTTRDKQHETLHQQQSEYQQDHGQGEWGFYDGYHQAKTQDKRFSAQKEVQTQRSLQASKQMAYQVFANVLTAIEEQEYREAKKYKLAKPEKSEAFIPDQSWKKDEDVLAGVEAQLTVFQAHMGFCPREVAEAAKVEMIDTTLYWAAARAEIGLPSTPTDRYAINLLEILYDGATSNTFQMLKESRKTFGRAELMENVGKIMAGQAKADHLDKQFRDDPRKEAKALPIRQGQNISDGIERLLTIAIDQGMKKRIRKHLQEHLETISAR